MKYVPPIGGDADAPYVDGNPTAGIKGSPVAAAAIEHPMREILAVITEAGLTPDEENLGQLLAAIGVLITSAAPGMATTVDAGLVRLATTAEAVAGTGDMAVTPPGLVAAIASALMPVGTVIDVAGKVAPTGFLKCNGAAYSRTAYSALFARLVTDQGFSAQAFTVTIASPAVCTKAAHGFAGGERLRLATTGALPTGLSTSADYFVEKIDANTFYLLSSEGGSRVNTSGSQSGTHSYTQSLYGLGDGTTTFNVPDLRGEFRRGWDDGRGVDAGRVVGSAQGDDTRNHYHLSARSCSSTDATSNSTKNFGYETYTPAGGGNVGLGYSATANYFPKTGSTGGTETRSRNRALLACIKH